MRLRSVCALIAWTASACAMGTAWAQARYPSKPVLVIVPLQAASPADVAARLLVERMGASLNASFVVENQPGAAGLIGTERAAKAAPDGYTLVELNNSIVTMIPNLREHVPYDPFKSFDPIVLIASVPTALVVNPAVAANSVAELTALAKEKPGLLNYSSGGPGSPQHVAMEMYKHLAGVDLTHVPYKGATQAAMDVISGQVQAAFAGMTLVLPYVKSGQMRALAIGGNRRTPLMPQLPTMEEAGVPGYNNSPWLALYAPAGTPREIMDKLSAAATVALAAPELRDRFAAQGLEVWGASPQETARVMREEFTRMRNFIKASGIKLD